MSGDRWVAFTKPLEQPFKVAAGQVVPLSETVYLGLKNAPGGAEAVFDVTPQPLPYALSMAGILLRRPPPCSVLYKFPCSECGARPGAVFTVCPRCHGHRTMWEVPASTHEAKLMALAEFWMKLGAERRAKACLEQLYGKVEISKPFAERALDEVTDLAKTAVRVEKTPESASTPSG